MSGLGEVALPLAASRDALSTGALMAGRITENEGEQVLARRFTNRWTKKSHDLTFEFSNDPGLLHQYHHMYEAQFRAVHNANRYQHVEGDDHNTKCHTLILRQGNFCVGGARLSVSTPRQPQALPVEINGFKFSDHFPDLKLKEKSYAQIGRFCLLPEFRGGNATQQMLWHLYRKSVALGMDMVFGTAPLLNARLYMHNFAAMGLTTAKMHPEITLPDYPMCEEIKFHLISLTIDHQQAETGMTEVQAVVTEQA